jgi:uncharacterized metal-binding protein YceD (DUF177 family)
MRLADFNIDLNRIKGDSETFNFEINNVFFELKNQSLYNQGEISVELKVEKLNNTVTFDYTIKGKLASSCERCLRDIHLKVDVSEKDVYKIIYTEQLENMDYTISASHPVVNVYDSIYDFICLSLPFRKLCVNSIEQLENCEINLESKDESENDDFIDDRWKVLNKLKK